MKKAVLVFLIICAAVVMLCFSYGCKKAPLAGAEEAYTEGEKAESGYANDFTLLDLNGEEVSLSDFEGKIVVLNFWATWCPPCKAEIPDFTEVCKLYEDKDVQFIGVSVDKDTGGLKKFVNDFNINYPVLVDNTVDNVAPGWNISGIPTTFILSKNGEVISSSVGMMTKGQLIKAIEEAL